MKLIIPNFWQQKNLLSILLWPLSLIYEAASFLMRYRKSIYIPKAKVITVGNITVGGAGKTPVVISIAQILQQYYKVAILTRGYKGKLIGPIMVNSSHDVLAVGDEALLLKRQADTCVAKDRLRGIKFLENLGYDLIITDDGMQDRRFTKALTIMVVDSYFAFGNGLVFPAGPLRQTITSGMAQANLIALIGKGKCTLPNNLPIFHANLISQQKLKSQKFIAFAGIGNPAKFFLSVEYFGGKVIKQIAFADHHQYTERELDQLIDLAKENQAKLITTEKDYVRISDEYRNQIEILSVELLWDDKHNFRQTLLDL